MSGIIWPSLPSTTITSQDSLTLGLFVYSFWNLGGLSNNVIQTSISTPSKILKLAKLLNDRSHPASRA
jgi:hypothetical protein